MRPATGTQFELVADTSSGRARAVVTELAAGLRSYAVNGIDLVEPFAPESSPPKGAGIVLVPWPNRVRDGKWSHGGATLQLALTEPAKRNAIHGLLRYFPYRERSRTVSTVTLEAPVFPQPGYPFQLNTSVTYALEADGLEVTHVLRNVGATDAPVAVGAHPYLRIGDVPSGELVLHIAADIHIDVDEQQIPVGESPVAGTPFDLRAGRVVGELDLDDGFAGVGRRPSHPGPSGSDPSPSDAGRVQDARSEHSLTDPHGRQVILWGDHSMRYVQVFTPRSFPGIDGQPRQAVAIEPMTAPADAFNSGTGLRWLAPGEEWTVRWGIRHAGLGAPSTVR
jgi:aldose 1-epimerase